MLNPYRVLEISPQATSADIRRAYRTLARRYHPDLGEESGERFVEVRAAYEILSDPMAREAYDRSREGYAQRRHQSQFTSAPPAAARGYASRRHDREFGRPLWMSATEVDELFRGAIDVFDLLERGWVHEGPVHQRDDALHYDLVLSPAEAASGGRFRFDLPVRRPCDACAVVDRLDCSACRGAGFVVDDRAIEIRVPAGVRDGARCALPLDALGVDGRLVDVTVRIG